MADFGGLMCGACLIFACVFNCGTITRGAKINQNKTTSYIVNSHQLGTCISPWWCNTCSSWLKQIEEFHSRIETKRRILIWYLLFHSKERSIKEQVERHHGVRSHDNVFEWSVERHVFRWTLFLVALTNIIHA